MFISSLFFYINVNVNNIFSNIVQLYLVSIKINILIFKLCLASSLDTF